MAQDAKLITSILEERLCSLGISLAPVASDKTAPDVLFVVRRATKSCSKDVVRVLAHSNVLKRECDFFREFFMARDKKRLQEERQRAEVAQMVQQVMRNVEEEAATRAAVAKMVGEVMNKIQRQEEEDGADGADEDGAGAPPPALKNETELESKHDHEEEDKEQQPKYTVIEKLDWAAPMLFAILAWIYTRCCHIDVEDLASVYEAAEKMIFTSLTGAIRDYNSLHYFRHALDNEQHMKALLRLSLRANCQELVNLRVLCDSLSNSPSTFSMVLESAKIPYRRDNFLHEGLYTISDHPICCLRESLDHSSSEPLRPYITLVRESSYYGRRVQKKLRTPRMYSPKMKSTAWRVMDLGGNPAKCCHSLFHYAVESSIQSARRAGMLAKPVKKESFSLRIVTGSMVSSILKGAIGKAIPAAELKVKEERGSGYYIRGPSYCFSLLLQGDPSMILVGAKAIPHDMVGRAALRIRNPLEKTFAKFLPAMMSFGVDLEANTLYIIKPLSSIIKILEFVAGLSYEAFTPMEYERHVVEIVEPTDPF